MHALSSTWNINSNSIIFSVLFWYFKFIDVLALATNISPFTITSSRRSDCFYYEFLTNKPKLF